MVSQIKNNIPQIAENSFFSDVAKQERNEAQKTISKQNYFGLTIRNKAIKNRDLIQSIDKYLLDNHKISLPVTKLEFNKLYPTGNFDPNSGELFWDSELNELIKMKYAICNPKGYMAMFPKVDGTSVLQPMAYAYSKNRLCAIWNMRKSQIIRSKYLAFLTEAKDNAGRLLTDHYQPVHLMLSVPHNGGLFQGKEFYACEIIDLFREMRDDKVWKKYVYSGEYGIEVKRSKNHGLHIHMHSFLLQKPEYTVNEVRDAIRELWTKITGNKDGKTIIWYESLYVYARDQEGNKIVEKKFVGHAENGDFEFTDRWKKDYIKPKDDLKKYLSGVMECIKYHFKPDCLEKPDGAHDIDLVKTILNNTKGKRLYSRFGDFYNQPLLNFNHLEKEDTTSMETIVKINEKADKINLYITDIEILSELEETTKRKKEIKQLVQELANISQYPKRKNKRIYKNNVLNWAKKQLEKIRKQAKADDSEPDLMTSTEGVEERLINPILLKKAQKSDYRIVIANPMYLRYNFQDLSKPQYETTVFTDKKLKVAPAFFTLKQVIKLDMQGFDICEKNWEIMQNMDKNRAIKKGYEKAKLPIYTPDKFKERYKQGLEFWEPTKSENTFESELKQQEIDREQIANLKANTIISDAELREKWKNLNPN